MTRQPTKQEPRRSLGIQAGRSFVRQLIQTANEFDLNKNGLYDGRSGCVNIWCSPDDKPSGWDVEVTKGGLDYPRDFVGALSWDWLSEEQVALYIDASPYRLLDEARKNHQELSENVWRSIFDWLTKKAGELIRLAQLQPETIGTQCPLCSFVMPTGHLLNDLLDHLLQEHQVRTLEVVLKDRPTVVTDRGQFELQSVERF